MPTVTPFAPVAIAPFQFQATLDGATYTATVAWNTYGQRWYVNIVDQNNTRILTKPLIGSPPGSEISLVAGYFMSTMVFAEDSRQFVVSP
jgi:hypothetical protein